MKRLLLIVCMLSPLVSFAGEEIQRVEGLVVDSVLVYGPVAAEISQGEPVLLLVRGNEYSLEQQPFFVQGSTLVLGRSKNGGDEDFSEVKFKLTLPELHSLQLAGSGEVYVQPLVVDDLSIALEGSGDMKFFAVTAQSINITASGSGDIELAELEVQSLEIVRAGSGDISLGSLVVERVTASISGSGDITAEEPAASAKLNMNIVGSGDINFRRIDTSAVEVNVMGSGTASVGDSTNMEANIIGSGDIHYRGNPHIESSILGSGNLHKQD